MTPGGSMVSENGLQLLFSEISQICKKSTTTKARETINTDLESLEFKSLKIIKFYLIKFATDLYFHSNCPNYYGSH